MVKASYFWVHCPVGCLLSVRLGPSVHCPLTSVPHDVISLYLVDGSGCNLAEIFKWALLKRFSYAHKLMSNHITVM